MTDDILFSQTGQFGLITLNRPNAFNALNLPMITSLYQQLLSWKTDPSIHAVIIEAVPGKAFCAGGDVRWLYQTGLENHAQQLEFFKHEYQLNYLIHQLGKPYIALMNGITMGGGVGISMHGSHPVATEHFSFAMPETGIGFFPDIGASHLLSACPHHLGLYLGLTGNRLDPHQTKQAGLLKHQIHSSSIPDVLNQLRTLDLSKDPNSRVDACLEAFAMKEAVSLDLPISLISECFSKRSLSLIIQALENNPELKAQEILTTLKQKSPLSLQVTFEQFRQAKGQSLSECLKMDFTLAQHFIKDKDFYEGVRALLIDKDKTPRWNPASLELVSTNQIASYFEREVELSLNQW